MGNYYNGCHENTAVNIKLTDECGCEMGGVLTISVGGNNRRTRCGCGMASWTTNGTGYSGTAWTSHRCGCGCGCND